jgi:hypothetical protein
VPPRRAPTGRLLELEVHRRGSRFPQRPLDATPRLLRACVLAPLPKTATSSVDFPELSRLKATEGGGRAGRGAGDSVNSAVCVDHARNPPAPDGAD